MASTINAAAVRAALEGVARDVDAGGNARRLLSWLDGDGEEIAHAELLELLRDLFDALGQGVIAAGFDRLTADAPRPTAPDEFRN